jgi:phospholipid/cholesterol/gamma-HCH transport system permease protein
MNTYVHGFWEKFSFWLWRLGGLSRMFCESLRYTVVDPPRRSIVLKQMFEIGVMSLPVVLITGAFTGMVLAVQTYYQFHKITMETAVGIIVGLSMTNELGPVLTAVMIAGRVGAAMAAELGTMKVTEQIDALKALAVDPVQYLIVPRFIACVALVPILTVFSVFVGIVGGYLVGVELKGINATFFIKNMLDFTKPADLLSGLIKTVVFAVIISIISCYEGFHAEGGAEGVGKATTEAVVSSAITVLIADFFLSIILF